MRLSYCDTAGLNVEEIRRESLEGQIDTRTVNTLLFLFGPTPKDKGAAVSGGF